MIDERPIFSVSEFVEYINFALGGRRVVVEGEVSGYSLNHGKWIFFDLKDENSKVSCFAAAWNLHTVLEDGMQIQVTGTPRLYPKTGRFSIMVERVELKGAGALRRAFELTKAKLEKEGLFDAARKRAIEPYPDAIGLVCSRESAAYTDFLRILNQRWGGVQVHLAHVHVQGESAVSEIVGAIEWCNAHGGELGIQTLVLIRGGGSLEDLQAFNAEPVARAVFGSRTPIICGVGHERDESLADYAADVRAATPTHAATLCVPDRSELLHSIQMSVRQAGQYIDQEIEWHAASVQRGTHVFIREVTAITHRCDTVLNRFASFLSLFESRAARMGDFLDRHATRLIKGAEQVVMCGSTILSSLERNLLNMNPVSVLKRGYAIVRKKGRLITSKQDVAAGDCVTIQLGDGDIPAVIDTFQGHLL